MEKLSRKQREIKRKKFDILNAAEFAFASKGFHGATMVEISAISEFPLATIYKLFGSKEKIYFELLKKKGKTLTKELEKSILFQDMPPEKKLKTGLETHYKFFQDNRNFTKIYLQERQRLGCILPDDLRNEIRGISDKLFRLFSQVFQEGIDKDQFKPYSSKESAELFVGMISSAVSNWLINGENDDLLKKRLDTSLSIFIGGISKN